MGEAGSVTSAKFICYVYSNYPKKKSNPCMGPDGSRRLRFPDFKMIGI
jgi:hypothetical protein